MAKRKSFEQLNNELKRTKKTDNSNQSGRLSQNQALSKRNRNGYKTMSANEVVKTLTQMKEYVSFQSEDEEEIAYFKNRFETLLKSRKGVLDVFSFLLLQSKDNQTINEVLNIPDIKGKCDQDMITCLEMYLKLSLKELSPLSSESKIGMIQQPKGEEFYNPTREKLGDAFTIMKGWCNQQINLGRIITITDVLNSFEIGLLPYYFPDGEQQTSIINALRYFFKNIICPEIQEDSSKTQYKSLKEWPQKKDIMPLMVFEREHSDKYEN